MDSVLIKRALLCSQITRRVSVKSLKSLAEKYSTRGVYLRRPFVAKTHHQQSFCFCLTRSAPLEFQHMSRRSQGVYSQVSYWGVGQLNNVSQRTLKTVAPKDFAPNTKSIEQVLLVNRCEYKHGHTSFVSKCFACHGKDKDGHGNKLTLFVNEVTGSYVCKNCGIYGSWSELTDNLMSQRASKGTVCDGAQTGLVTDNKTVENGFELEEGTQSFESLPTSLQDSLIHQFGLQKISWNTFRKYCVMVGKCQFVNETEDFDDPSSLIFPMFDFSRKSLIGAKYYSSKPGFYPCVRPSGHYPGLFGWHTIKPLSSQVVLTANEIDALAVNEATGLPAMALPNGNTSLPPEVLPQLEQFSKIVFWFNNDVKSRQAITQFSRKLGMQRCFFVRNTDEHSLGNQGALEALNRNLDLETVIARAHSVGHPEILTFEQLRHDLYTELSNAEEAAGIKWRRFPKLSAILKGHRKGELTIFTGPTGAGKTTLLSELSVDLSAQGVSTLWGSFEVRNTRLLRTIINQFTGLEMESNLDDYDRWASKLEALPLYFMNFYGSQNLRNVIETMNHAAYVYDIDHVIIDNLQFMTDGQISSKYDDRFHVLNCAISAFRKFASTKNVHVTLVVHPRKENDNAELQTASVFGTAKATQEADNVLILQNGKEGTKYLEITKNRYDGTLGKIPLNFHRRSLAMSGFHRNEKTKEVSF